MQVVGDGGGGGGNIESRNNVFAAVKAAAPQGRWGLSVYVRSDGMQVGGRGGGGGGENIDGRGGVEPQLGGRRRASFGAVESC